MIGGRLSYANVALAGAAAALLGSPAPAPAVATEPAADAVPGRVLVGYEPGVGAGDAARLRSRLGLARVRALRIGRRADVIRVHESGTRELAARARDLAARPGIAWAQPDYLIYADRLPPDALFGRAQWALRNTGSWTLGGHSESSTAGADIDAPAAWDITTGSPSVTVGVVDTGVYAAHREFEGRLLPGRDFISSDANPDDESSDGHGTAVASIIGGRANTGTVGVAWDVRLLPARAVAVGDGEPAGAVSEALAYVSDRGADVVNMSFGSAADAIPALDAVFNAHPQTLYVAAAGNGGADGIGDDNDADPRTPCNSPAPNVICVANTTDDDLLAASSNFGHSSVDLAAPGMSIAAADGAPATRTPTRYTLHTGTSFAAPHVSGIAVLLRAGTPWNNAARIKSCILLGAEPVPSLAGITVTGGRANARRALDACADRTAPETAATLQSPAPGARLRSRDAVFRFSPGGDSESGVAATELLIDGQPFPTAPVGAGALAPTSQLTHGGHAWTIRVVDRSGNHRDAATRPIQIDNRGPAPRLKLLGASARKGILLRIKVDEPAKTSASALLSRKVSKKIRSRKRTLACKTPSSLPAGSRKVRIKLAGPLRRRGAGQRFKLSLTLADDLGNVTRKSLSVKLRR